MNIKWDVKELVSKASDGFVITAHWTVVAKDGRFSASSYGSCGFDGELTTPYESLTKEQVLSWVWQTVNKEETEASLAAQVEAKKTPALVTNTLPWDIPVGVIEEDIEE